MTHETPDHASHAPQEHAARETLSTLEYPRMVSHADGRQTRVENAKEAEAAMAKGATLLPTVAVPSPDDGGTPNADQVVIVAAIGPSRVPTATVTVVPAVKAAKAAPDTDAAAKAAHGPVPEDEPEHKGRAR
jgi:hypothetical protein